MLPWSADFRLKRRGKRQLIGRKVVNKPSITLPLETCPWITITGKINVKFDNAANRFELFA